MKQKSVQMNKIEVFILNVKKTAFFLIKKDFLICLFRLIYETALAIYAELSLADVTGT